MKEFVENNAKFLVFATMGTSIVNGLLMSQGIETMPGMWIPEVYKDPLLGMSIGSMTGISIGAVAGTTAVLAKDAVVASMSALRNKFSDASSENTMTPKM